MAIPKKFYPPAGGMSCSWRASHEEEAGIPLREQELKAEKTPREGDVTKRPVMKEEVRARKQRRTEERNISGKIRKEDIEIDRSGEAKKR